MNENLVSMFYVFFIDVSRCLKLLILCSILEKPRPKMYFYLLGMTIDDSILIVFIKILKSNLSIHLNIKGMIVPKNQI